MATLLFDIDFTLIDSAKLKDIHFENIVRKTSFDRKQLENIFSRYISYIGSAKNFKIDDFSQILSKLHRTKISVIESIFYNISFYKKCIYPDIKQNLKKLSNLGHHLGIFSEGDINFQTIKLLSVEISDILNQELIFISDKKDRKRFLSNVPAESIIIDDNLAKLQRIKKLMPSIEPIHINRLKSKSDSKLTTINDLNQLLQLLKE